MASRSLAQPFSLASVLEQSPQLKAAMHGLDRMKWRSIVGPRIAERSKPLKLEQGELRLMVSSSAWAQELSLLQEDLIERLKGAGFSVSKIRFQVGSIEESIERRRKLRPPTPRSIPQELQERLDQIDDEKLRERIRSAYQLSRS